MNASALVAMLILAALAAAEPEPPPAKPGVVDPSPPPGSSEAELLSMVRVVSEPSNVDELLSALETADRGVRTLQASLMYDRRFLLQGDRHVRLGRLSYEARPAHEEAFDQRPKRTFAVEFRILMIEGTKRDDVQTWVFDGEWLVEKRLVDKQYIARQVARPGDPADPLALGESPIPFPIGQKKTAILERYEATMLPAEDGLAPPADADDNVRTDLDQRRTDVTGTYQLRLIPRGEHAEEDPFKEIRLWYTRDTFLPRMARTVNRAGDDSIVLLVNAKLNEAIPPHAIRIDPPPTEEGWDVQIDSGRYEEQAP
jgi:outer membrane lipoprotein-sorting protein